MEGTKMCTMCLTEKPISQFRKGNGRDGLEYRCNDCFREYQRKCRASKPPTYYIWRGMVSRCCYKSDKQYKFYGGRGITICDEWRYNFDQFNQWAIRSGYQEGLTIDRIDCNGNYCPENCRWIAFSEQANNKRNNRRIVWDGQEMTVAQLSRYLGISYNKAYKLATEGAKNE